MKINYFYITTTIVVMFSFAFIFNVFDFHALAIVTLGFVFFLYSYFLYFYFKIGKDVKSTEPETARSESSQGSENHSILILRLNYYSFNEVYKTIKFIAKNVGVEMTALSGCPGTFQVTPALYQFGLEAKNVERLKLFKEKVKRFEAEYGTSFVRGG